MPQINCFSNIIFHFSTLKYHPLVSIKLKGNENPSQPCRVLDLESFFTLITPLMKGLAKVLAFNGLLRY